MNLREAFDFVATLRPAWKSKAAWNAPFCYNREHALRLLGADRNVKRITKASLAAMRARLIKEKRSPGGINRIISMTHTLLRDLADEEIIDKAPKLKPLKENNQRTAFFTQEQITEMVALARQYHHEELADAILFGVFTGCRQAELLNLTAGDVDLANNLLTFRDTKNGEDHIIDIHPDLRQLLAARVEDAGEMDPVFEFENDDQLRRDFYKIRDELKIPTDRVWHTLRHTTGTWLAERGVPIQTIARVLNHKQVSTSQRYTKISDKARKTAINSL